ncbi:viral A-type inclusion protein, partial [Reticulomyxa filosa]
MKKQLDVFLRQSLQNKFTTIDQQVKSTNDEMTIKMEELQNKLNELMLSQKQVAATANEADERSISEILKNLEVAYKTNEDIKTLIESNSRTFTSELALLPTKLLQEIEKNLEKSKEISQSNEHRTEEERKQPTEELNDLEKIIESWFANLSAILSNRETDKDTDSTKTLNNCKNKINNCNWYCKEITLQNLESFDSRLQTVLNKLLDACTFLKIAQRASSTEFESNVVVET